MKNIFVAVAICLLVVVGLSGLFPALYISISSVIILGNLSWESISVWLVVFAVAGLFLISGIMLGTRKNKRLLAILFFVLAVPLFLSAVNQFYVLAKTFPTLSEAYGSQMLDSMSYMTGKHPADMGLTLKVFTTKARLMTTSLAVESLFMTVVLAISGIWLIRKPAAKQSPSFRTIESGV